MGVLAAVASGLKTGLADPRIVWRDKARPEQLLPGGQWRVWYLQGGRGSGKTRSGAGALGEWILSDTDGEGEYGIIAPTYADAWTKCVEGESGLLRALGTSMAEIKDHRSATVRSAWRTYGQVVMRNGIVVYIDSAAEGGLRIQGRNLKGAWCDEIGLWEKWETAWGESLKYAVRMGRSRIICTGTPKASRPARKLIRSFIRNEPEHGGVVTTKLRTVDNAANLSEEFYRAVVGAAKGTRLERQELEGDLLDDVANALWTRDILEKIQCPGVGQPGGPAELIRPVIGVDPSDGSEESDEQAYTVAGLYPAGDPRIYVAESWGGQEAPALFARRVIRRAAEIGATIIVEKNHGGKWLETVFAQVRKDEHLTGVPVRVIHASQAKRTRAEPVSALYERNYGQTVFHAGGPFVDLEDQMATFTGAQGERSPDRLDSLVWAITPYLNLTFGPIVKPAVQQWAAGRELEDIAVSHERMAHRRLAGAHGGAYRSEEWDLDSFAPHAPDDEPGAYEDDGKLSTAVKPERSAPSVHEWR
jgi:phage terminase large subunit-like protein